MIRDGAKVTDGKMEVDLEHHLLPDPIADTLMAMQSRIDQLERRLEEYIREENEDAPLQYGQRAKRRTGAVETA